MRKILILLVITTFSFSCKNNENNMNRTSGEIQNEQSTTSNESHLGTLLQGNHELIKNGNTYLTYIDKENVMFTWVNKNGLIYNSFLPITKILFKYDSNISEPYIKFKWDMSDHDYGDNINAYFENYICYIVVYSNFTNLNQLLTNMNNPHITELKPDDLTNTIIDTTDIN